MPVRDLIVAVLLLVFVLVVAFVAEAMGSEFYLFIPPFRRMKLQEPPTSPWALVVLFAIAVIVFCVYRRHAAILISSVLGLAILGIPTGILIYSWTPGIAQYALIVALGALVAFIWTHEDFYQD